MIGATNIKRAIIGAARSHQGRARDHQGADEGGRRAGGGKWLAVVEAVVDEKRGVRLHVERQVESWQLCLPACPQRSRM